MLKKLSDRKLVIIKFLNGKTKVSFIDNDNFISHYCLVTYNGIHKISSIDKLKINDIFCFNVLDVYSSKYLACNLKEWI